MLQILHVPEKIEVNEANTFLFMQLIENATNLFFWELLTSLCFPPRKSGSFFLYENLAKITLDLQLHY